MKRFLHYNQAFYFLFTKFYTLLVVRQISQVHFNVSQRVRGLDIVCTSLSETKLIAKVKIQKAEAEGKTYAPWGCKNLQMLGVLQNSFFFVLLMCLGKRCSQPHKRSIDMTCHHVYTTIRWFGKWKHLRTAATQTQSRRP